MTRVKNLKTVILPGYSPHNKNWAYEIKNDLNTKDVEVVEWKHWEKGSMSIAQEVKRVDSILESERCNIIAKSVGTRVLMKVVVSNSSLNLGKVVLCGIPTKFETGETKKLYENGLKVIPPSQLVVFQNSNDPFSPFKVVNGFVRSVDSKIRVIEKESSTHNYPYGEDFKKELYS